MHALWIVVLTAAVLVGSVSMVLTAARNTVLSRTSIGDLLRIPMAADAVCFLGGMVCIDADGYAVAAADTADYKFAGIAVEDPQNPALTANGCYDNTGGDDGDREVVVQHTGRYRMTLAVRTPQQDMLFAWVYVYDDDHVAVHEWDVANDVGCGAIIRLPASTAALHPDEQFGTDEVEVVMAGVPFNWTGDVTTEEPTTTTTEQGL